MGGKTAGGGVGKKYNVKTNSDLNVTPLVDVMLVLLIIFMVAAPLATVSIKLDLPPAVPPKDPLVKPKPPTVISLQKSGHFFIGTQETRIENLVGDVTRALNDPNPTTQTVYIRSDNEVRYVTFMDVLNTLQDAGFYKISLITEDRI